MSLSQRTKAKTKAAATGSLAADLAGAKAAAPAPTKRLKQPLNARIDPELLDQAKNAVFWSSPHITLSELVERGLAASLADLERERNNGKPYPERTEEKLKGGAKLK